MITWLSAPLQWLWETFQWPTWASGCSILLATCLTILHVVAMATRRAESSVNGKSTAPESEHFKRFQRQYLIVYFLVMFADWLQGTHMYSLYESYGMNISALFLTGFLSSAILGNAVGPLVDKYGRRNACIVFCVLEIVINVMENFPSMPVLLVGRVLGGLSTSLLFSAFESWMVTEHRARGFSEESIAKTFAIASEANGMLAVLAGVAAQFAADASGEIGPFRLAVVITVIAMGFILPWNENYGAGTIAKEEKAKPRSEVGWSPSVYAVGMCYSLFEGAMYIFVFLWYPTLYAVVPDSLLPSGLVFSCLMICIAIGGKIFDMAGTRISEEKLAVGLCSLSAAVFVVPVVSSQYEHVLAAFLIFETCVGAFSPCSGTLRSRYFPRERLSTVLGTFRLPANILVVLGTGGSNYFAREQLFQFCSLVMLAAAACGVVVAAQTRKAQPKFTAKLKRA